MIGRGSSTVEEQLATLPKLVQFQSSTPVNKLNIILGYVPGIYKDESNSSYGTISK